MHNGFEVNRLPEHKECKKDTLFASECKNLSFLSWHLFPFYFRRFSSSLAASFWRIPCHRWVGSSPPPLLTSMCIVCLPVVSALSWDFFRCSPIHSFPIVIARAAAAADACKDRVDFDYCFGGGLWVLGGGKGEMGGGARLLDLPIHEISHLAGRTIHTPRHA